MKRSGFAVFLFGVMNQYAKDHGTDALERAISQARQMMSPKKGIAPPPGGWPKPLPAPWGNQITELIERDTQLAAKGPNNEPPTCKG